MSESTARHYLLKDQGSAQPQFSVEKPLVLSGRNSASNIVLGSGFSLTEEDRPFPVSAALQLNGDFTHLEDAALASFAEAELERHHRISYRSYDVEPNFRVCVLADQPSLLSRFSETYGAILEIEPLLVGQYHEEFGSPEDLKIVRSGRGYQLEYTLKSPVSRSLCTYCGLCGRICPEKCISENLYIDFGACTFCTDCEKNCPEKAIDLYGIERISLDVPAIIVLGDPHLSLPDDKSTIFKEDQVSEYLATLYSCQVSEVITCDHTICHLNGGTSTATGCRACLQACSFGAFKVRERAIAIDPFACTECGSCVSVCPTGAMQNQKLTDRSFLEFFRTFNLQSGNTVIIGSPADLQRLWWYGESRRYEGSLFFELVTGESIALMHLLVLLGMGASRIIVLSRPGSSNKNAATAVAEANHLFDKLFGVKNAAVLCSPDDIYGEQISENCSGASFSPIRDLSFVNRRLKLSAVLEYLVRSADRRIALQDGEVRFFGTLTCDEDLCTQCLACLNSCPIEALSADPATLTLGWNGGRCVGCRSCTEACPENALSYSGQAVLAEDYFQSKTIAQAEPMRCEGCGKIFGTKKSFNRVIDILSKKQQNPPEHLQYCEDCRVLKILENQ
jgi:ferredoxin